MQYREQGTVLKYKVDKAQICKSVVAQTSGLSKTECKKVDEDLDLNFIRANTKGIRHAN